jgi:hypothetical protein
LLPPAAIEKLVRQDLQKAAVLKNAYGVEIAPAQIEAEVRRIDSTTRAPEMLAELKVALGNDPLRFGRTVARPIVVERELRQRFDNDDKLHAPQRRRMETIRERLLSARKGGMSNNELLSLLKTQGADEVTDKKWQLAVRPARPKPDNLEAGEIRERFGPNAQVLSSPASEETLYLEDLPAQLQQVLNAQMRQAGDITAVIEMPNRFLLYVAREKSVEALSVRMLSIPKRSYDEWHNRINPPLSSR